MRCKLTPQAIGPAAAKTQQYREPSTLAAAVSRGQGLYCFVLCVLGGCVCVWSPTSGTKGAGPAWCQKLQQKCAKLSAVIRSKLFLHEYENNTHEAEQALPAWRGAGRSSRGMRPLLSSSGGARGCRICLRCLAEENQNKIIDRKVELCHHRPQSNAQSKEYENNTHKSFKMGFWVCGSRGVRDVHVLTCTRVVQIGVAVSSVTAAAVEPPPPREQINENQTKLPGLGGCSNSGSSY